MGATIALIMFAAFIGLDYVLHARKESQEQKARQLAPVPVTGSDEAPEPVWVGGFELVPGLSYHPGHTWVHIVSPDTAVVGMDDFARRLVGKIDKVEMPKAGRWLLQGGEGVGIKTARGRTQLTSPVEGEVVRVNKDVAKDPSVASTDPYRRGWLFEIRGPHLVNNLRNLMRGSLAQSWTQDAKNHLMHRLVGLSGTVMADGGEPAEDFADHLEPEQWEELTRSFLAS